MMLAAMDILVTRRRLPANGGASQIRTMAGSSRNEGMHIKRDSLMSRNGGMMKCGELWVYASELPSIYTCERTATYSVNLG